MEPQAQDDSSLLTTDLLLATASLAAPDGHSVRALSPAALAYLGDAVYELFVRARYLVPPKRIQDYHRAVVNQVRAESQARHLQMLQPHLTSAEQELVRKGRNAATRRPKRLDAETYQQATSLETLFGYLYLTDPPRLVHLLTQISLEPNPLLSTPSQEPAG